MSDKPGEAEKEFDDDFLVNGYLSKAMRHMQAHIRAKYPDKFEIAEDLNRLAQQFYVKSTLALGGKSSHDPFCIAIQIVPRALSAYQGAMIATERGMHIEALTLARGIYETAFWLGYLHQKPVEARHMLFAQTLHQELETHRLSLETVKDNPKLLALARQRMSDLGTEQKKYQRKRISIDELAKKSGFANRYGEYRILCNMAAHVSLQSTFHYLNAQPDGSFNGHIIGPDEDAVADVFVYACGAIIMVIEAMRWITKDTSFDTSFQNLMGRYAEQILAVAEDEEAILRETD